MKQSKPVSCSSVGALAIIIAIVLFFGLGSFLNQVLPS